MFIPEQRVRMGTTTTAAARENGLTNEDVFALENIMEEIRDKKPAEHLRFE